MTKQKKTTVSLCYVPSRPHFYGYPLTQMAYSPGFFSLLFTGTDADKWNNDWLKFLEPKMEVEREKFEAEKRRTISELTTKLLTTKKRLFSCEFENVRNALKKTKEEVYKMDNYTVKCWAYEFLPKDMVKISEGDNTTIYELLN